MGDKKKGKGGSKLGTLVLLLVVAVVGAGVLGYFRPDTPVVGPLVSDLLDKAAEGQDQAGVYRVTIEKVVLDPQEFEEDAEVDIQVVIRKITSDGDESFPWRSRDYGENIREVGKDSLATNWAETPFEISWRHGDQIIVEVWEDEDYRKFAHFKSDADSQEFPLKGTRELKILDGDREIAGRKGGTNQIVFTHERTGDIGADDAGE